MHIPSTANSTTPASPPADWHVQAVLGERGGWVVKVNGRVVSDHATHTAARIAARQLLDAGPPPCTCEVDVPPREVVVDGRTD